MSHIFTLAFVGLILLSATAVLAQYPEIRRAQPGTARNPVLLVHGFCDSARSMKIMQRWLEKHGWKVFSVDLVPSDGRASLEELALQLATYVNQTIPNYSKIDIVGFSMGGLVSRYYVQRLNGAARVERLITISAPHHGTWLAYLSQRPGCREMRPTSALLNSLNNDLDSLRRIRFMSVWTPLDLMIIPASSSRLPVGHEQKTWIVAHRLMILQGTSLRRIEQFLLDQTYDQSPVGVAIRNRSHPQVATIFR
jgi:triacylglycerol lipase